MGLSFLTPVFLFGGLAIAVPLVLHLLRRDRVPAVPFSDVRFLRQRMPERLRRRRLRELLLLALRVTALLLLALAFARPFLADPAGATRPATVVLVDTSFSMAAGPQATAARDAALEAIDAAPDGHLVGVVAFDSAARVEMPLGDARIEARAAVRRLTARPHGTRYVAGLAAAATMIGERDGRVVLVTDRQAAGWEEAVAVLPADLDVTVRAVAPAAGNTAVVAIEPDATGVEAMLLRTGTAGGRATTVALEIDGAPVATLEVPPARGQTRVRFPVTPPASGVVSVSVEDGVGPADDDRRYRLLDPPEPALALLVSDDPRRAESRVFVERALAPAALAPVFRTRVVGAASLGDTPLERGGVVVLLGTAGLDRGGRERLAGWVRAGGGLLLAAGPALDPALVDGLFGADAPLGVGGAVRHEPAVAMTWTSVRHPIVLALGMLAPAFGQARFQQTVALDPVGGTVLARFGDGRPAMVARQVGDGRVLLFGSDLGDRWNDLPRRPVFAPWLVETLTHLRGGGPPARELVVGEAPPGAPDRPGVATLVDEGAERRIVLNVDPRESDPTPLEAAAFETALGGTRGAARVTADSAGDGEASRLWRLLLLVTAVVLVGEALLGRRAA